MKKNFAIQVALNFVIMFFTTVIVGLIIIGCAVTNIPIYAGVCTAALIWTFAIYIMLERGTCQ